jgi:hypothetical protein
MLVAQYSAPPRIQQPNIVQPYVSPTNSATPTVGRPVIRQPLTASFILSLPLAISPSKRSGCFDVIATNSTSSTALLHKVIGISLEGREVTTVPQGSVGAGKSERFTFCGLSSLLSVQFTQKRSF